MTLTKYHTEWITLALSNTFDNQHFEQTTILLNHALDELHLNKNLIKKTFN